MVTTHITTLREWYSIDQRKIEYMHFALGDELQHFSPRLQANLRSILLAAEPQKMSFLLATPEPGIEETGSVGGVIVVGRPEARIPVPVRVCVELLPLQNENHSVVLAFPFVWRWSPQNRQDLEQAVRLGLQFAADSSWEHLPVAYLCPGFAASTLFDSSLSFEGLSSLQVSLALAAYGVVSKQICSAKFFFTGKVRNDHSIGNVDEVAVKTRFLKQDNFASSALVRPRVNGEHIDPDLKQQVIHADNLFEAMQILSWRRPFDSYLCGLAQKLQINDVVLGGVVNVDKDKPITQIFPMRIQRIQDKNPVNIAQTELFDGTGLALLVGDPNNGKTSYMTTAVYDLAQSCLKDPTPHALLPVLLDIADCLHHKKNHRRPLTWGQVLTEMIADKIERSSRTMKGEISRVILFLDGWDRIRDQDFFSGILQWCQSNEEHPRRIILASRLGMEPNPCPPDVPVFHLADLEPSEVREYLNKLGKTKTLQLYQSIEQRHGLRRSPFTNRMFLRILGLGEDNLSSSQFASTGSLMVALMQDCLHRLFRKGLSLLRKHQEQGKATSSPSQPLSGLLQIGTESECFDLLRPVCFYLANLQRESMQTSLSGDSIKQSIRTWLSSDSLAAQDLKEYGIPAAPLFGFLCDQYCGLLVQQTDGTYRFRHDSFFDYCAAKYLAQNNQTDIAGLLEQNHANVALYLSFLLSPEQLLQVWETYCEDNNIDSSKTTEIHFTLSSIAVQMFRFFLQLSALREDTHSLISGVTQFSSKITFLLRMDWHSHDDLTHLLRQHVSRLRDKQLSAVQGDSISIHELAIALRSLGSVLVRLGRYDEASTAHLEQVSLFRFLCGLTEHSTIDEQLQAVQHQPRSVRDLAIGMNRLGTALGLQGHHEKSKKVHLEEVFLRRLLSELTEHSTIDERLQVVQNQPSLVRGLTIGLGRLGTVLNDLGHYEKSKKVHLEEVSLKRLLCGLTEHSTIDEQQQAIRDQPNPVRDLAMGLGRLGTALNNLGHYEKSKTVHLEEVSLKRLLCGLTEYSTIEEEQQVVQNQPRSVRELTIALRHLVTALDCLDQYEEAKKVHLEGVSLSRLLCGLYEHSTEDEQRQAAQNQPRFVGDLASALGRMGTLLRKLHHYDDAHKVHLEQVTLSRLLCGIHSHSAETEQTKAMQDNPNSVRGLALALKGLGTLQCSQNRNHEAFQSLQEAALYMRGLAGLSERSDDVVLIKECWHNKPRRVQELLDVLQDLVEVCVAIAEESLVSSLNTEIARLEDNRPQD